MSKRQKVQFIATKYKNRRVKINFYTKGGKMVEFNAVKKVPTKAKVEFYIKKRR